MQHAAGFEAAIKSTADSTHLEKALGGGAAGMHHALGNALAVKLRARNKIFESLLQQLVRLVHRSGNASACTICRQAVVVYQTSTARRPGGARFRHLRDLLGKVVVLQQHRAAHADGQRLVVVVDRRAGIGRPVRRVVVA